MVDTESDEELDYMKAVMKSKMWTYNPRNEIKFQKGMLLLMLMPLGLL